MARASNLNDTTFSLFFAASVHRRLSHVRPDGQAALLHLRIHPGKSNHSTCNLTANLSNWGSHHCLQALWALALQTLAIRKVTALVNCQIFGVANKVTYVAEEISRSWCQLTKLNQKIFVFSTGRRVVQPVGPVRAVGRVWLGLLHVRGPEWEGSRDGDFH